ASNAASTNWRRCSDTSILSRPICRPPASTSPARFSRFRSSGGTGAACDAARQLSLSSRSDGMRNTVFIQSNHRQLLGALVSAYSLRRNSSSPESFDVRILNSEDFPFLAAREGQEFLRDGRKHLWKYDDLQSFTPLRFMLPELMNYQGRAVVIDPDVFAVGDIAELFGRDMEGKAIFCRYREGKGDRPGYFASSVMLLACARLQRWQCQRNFEE